MSRCRCGVPSFAAVHSAPQSEGGHTFSPAPPPQLPLVHVPRMGVKVAAAGGDDLRSASVLLEHFRWSPPETAAHVERLCRALEARAQLLDDEMLDSHTAAVAAYVSGRGAA